jgi:deoxynucleotidyltransferase terminal-interacting protein 1
MPSVRVNRRLRTVDAIERNAIHQSLATPSSRVAIDRCKSAVLNDPVQAIEVLRALLQPSINEEVKKVLQKFSDTYFHPAINNARANLGNEMVPKTLLEDVCVSALEHAKLMFKATVNEAPYDRLGKEALTGRRSEETTSQSAILRIKRKKKKKKKKSCDVESKPNTDIILLTKSGKPVRREGEKWLEDRLTPETLFILGSRANKALGFGQTRGRLYIKHPELFK